MQLLGRQQRKAGAELEPHLVPEDAAGAGAGAIGLDGAVIQNMANQGEVLPHQRNYNAATASASVERRSLRPPVGGVAGWPGSARGCPRAGTPALHRPPVSRSRFAS